MPEEVLQPFAWLIPQVLAGGPHPERLDRVQQSQMHCTFDAVLSVYEQPLSKQALAPWSPRYLWLETDEAEAPDLKRACAFIDAARRDGVATFVHCFAGLGRTGTVLAAYLLFSGEVATAAEARDMVRRTYNPAAIESAEQERALEAFARKRWWQVFRR